jgi:hypothetical protein
MDMRHPAQFVDKLMAGETLTRIELNGVGRYAQNQATIASARCDHNGYAKWSAVATKANEVMGELLKELGY